MRAPRVVIVSHTAQLGGGERALLRLIDALDRSAYELSAIVFEDGELVGELRRRGLAVELVPLGALNEVTRDLTVSLVLTMPSAREVWSFMRHFVRTTKSFAPDLIVANTLKAATMVAATSPFVRRRWVWHLHDRLAADYLPARTARALRLMAKTLPRHVVVNSRATLATLGRMRPGRASVAYPGLEMAAFAEGENRHAECHVVGTLGRLSATKGQWEFVEASEKVLEVRPDTRFQIVGAALFQDGDYEERVRARVTSTGLQDRIEFTGWATDPEQSMRRFGIFVHVPPVPEPFGQAVVEAMVSGIPVVTADAGGSREILDQGNGRERVGDGVVRTELGMLVAPGNPEALARAIIWALDHPEELSAMVAKAAVSARARFDIVDTARAVDAAWRSALGRRREGTGR